VSCRAVCRHSPRASTRQPAPGEEVEPTWLENEEGADGSREDTAKL
jgi:hypothetical protein